MTKSLMLLGFTIANLLALAYVLERVASGLAPLAIVLAR